MKRRHSIFHEYYSNKIARKGIGLLIPSTAISFLSGRCVSCGHSISDFTIFGNALVLEDNGVLSLKCLECRVEGKIRINKPMVLRGTINKNMILIDLNERIEKQEVTWIQMIIAWQKNYVFLQDEINYEKAYNIKVEDTVNNYMRKIIDSGFENEISAKKIYGSIENLNSCGECAAFWSNNYTKHKIPDLMKEGKCWHCGIPHEFQWNMRTSFDKEIEKIKKTTLIY